MTADRWLGAAVAAALLCATSAPVIAQSSDPPRLRATAPTGIITIDGLLNELAWATAEQVDNFRQTDPVEGAPATARTVVRVLADPRAIFVGINV